MDRPDVADPRAADIFQQIRRYLSFVSQNHTACALPASSRAFDIAWSRLARWPRPWCDEANDLPSRTRQMRYVRENSRGKRTRRILSRELFFCTRVDWSLRRSRRSRPQSYGPRSSKSLGPSHASPYLSQARRPVRRHPNSGRF